jgi:hypothetical protein
MATKNFTQFDLRTPLLTSDYIVGYKADGSAEYKATVKQVVDLIQDSDSQTLSFNEANNNLTISSGNTVSLSSFTTNTDFNSYKTDVASATATFLPTTTYQNASAFSIVAGGNTRTANITIGTNDAYHLRFETNNNARMTILSGGEVGVGTTITETQVAGNGGLIVKNNLLVGGTTIKETVNLTLSSVVNGDFENITSLTAEPGGEWYSGTPIGWTSNNATPITYTVFNGAGGDRVANVSQVSDGPGLLSFRQNLGALQTLSDINVTFNYVSSSIAPWSTGTLNAAIYDGSFNALATNTYTTSGTYILSAAAVPVGTTIIVGFWSEGFTTPGLNNVTVAQVTNTALTVAGGVSASSVITSRLQVRDGVVIFTNLPTLSTGLPSGAIWNSNGFLRVV